MFLNTIEYLDEKTNEWTTFVPKENYDIHYRRRSRNRRNSRKSVSEESNRKPSIDIDSIPVQNENSAINA